LQKEEKKENKKIYKKRRGTKKGNWGIMTISSRRKWRRGSDLTQI
jgi:hypothetical protein